MAEILKKHKKAVILMGVVLLLAVSVLSYSCFHQQRLRNQADFIVTLDGKEILIPCNVADLSVSWDVIDPSSENHDFGSVMNTITLVAGQSKDNRINTKDMYPARFYCLNMEPRYMTAIVRYHVLGLYISREYTKNASINGISLNDSREQLFEKLGKPALSRDMGNGIISYSYYYDLSPKASLYFLYSEKRGNFDSFELARDGQ